VDLRATGARALARFGILGLVGVLLDLDHLPVLVWKGLAITPENFIHHGGRPLHGPALVGCGLYCGYRLASLHRLRHRTRVTEMTETPPLRPTNPQKPAAPPPRSVPPFQVTE